MKIGIITYHRGTNYGAFLQAWSLKSFLEKEISASYVQIIDYQSEKQEYSERKVFRPRWKRDWFNPIKLRRLIKYSKFVQWQRNYFNTLSTPLRKIDLNKMDFDLVIYGSDEIWNINNWYKMTDPYLFGKGTELIKKRISYAPSCGSSTLELFKSHPDIVRLISNFSNLSVRDYLSAELLKELGFDASIVLDPTFLVDWDSIMIGKKRAHKSRYVLLNISQVERFSKILPELKKKLTEEGLELINLTYTNEINGIKNINSPHPFDWVNYYYHAEHIITDTFHGTVFAINSKNQFTVMDPGEKKNKTIGILNTCGIKRELKSFESVFSFDSVIDYTEVNKVVLHEIEKSKKYLISVCS